MRELRQRFFLRLTTWLTLTACFSVLAAASLAAINLEKILTLWGDDLQITAYLDKDVSEARRQEIEDQVGKNQKIGRVEFISKEKSLEDFRAQLASYAPDLSSDDELLSLIPASLQISLSQRIPASEQVETIAQVAQDLQKTPGIEDVRYGQEWVKKYSAVLSAINGSTGLIGLILGLTALLVIGNAVRASVEARRQEIEVLELVGATAWMIRQPFVLEGAALGFLSSLSAIIASAVGFSVLQKLVRGELQFLQIANHLQFFSFSSVMICLIVGTALGAIASALCVRRINSGWAASGGRG